jgi:hypothetical protein
MMMRDMTPDFHVQQGGGTPVPADEPSDDAKIASTMQNILAIAEGVVGYVKTLINGGISQEMAEQMGKSYHDEIMAQIHAAHQTQQATQAVDILKMLGGKK